MANLGDRRPAEQLPGYDGPDANWPWGKRVATGWEQPTLEERIWLTLDWRSPLNMQVYADPTLDLDNLLNLPECSNRLRPVKRHEAAAAFSLMMGLADDRLFSEADELSFSDIAERPVARAYQAALKVLDAHYYDKRLRVTPAYLAAARIVLQCVDVELLLRDMHQKKRELSALANGKSRRLSPGTFNVVPDILAHWRGLQIGGKKFKGSRLDAASNCYERDRSALSESYYRATSGIQEEYGCYANELAIPPEKVSQKWYNRVVNGILRPHFFWAPAPRPAPACFEEGRNKRTDKPKPALQIRELPDKDSLGPWRAEALEYWGIAEGEEMFPERYWGNTKLPQGLADGYLQPDIFPAYNGARDYDSDPVLIWHPQLPADWGQLIDALPEGTQKTKLQDKNAEIEWHLNKNHKSASYDYLSGGHRKSKAVPPPAPCRTVSISLDRDLKRQWTSKYDWGTLSPIEDGTDNEGSAPLRCPVNNLAGVDLATPRIMINWMPSCRHVGIRHRDFCGPVTQIKGKLYPRAAAAARRIDHEPTCNELADELHARGIPCFGPQDEGWEKRFPTWERYIRHLAHEHEIPEVDDEILGVDEQIETGFIFGAD